MYAQFLQKATRGCQSKSRLIIHASFVTETSGSRPAVFVAIRLGNDNVMHRLILQRATNEYSFNCIEILRNFLIIFVELGVENDPCQPKNFSSVLFWRLFYRYSMNYPAPNSVIELWVQKRGHKSWDMVAQSSQIKVEFSPPISTPLPLLWGQTFLRPTNIFIELWVQGVWINSGTW